MTTKQDAQNDECQALHKLVEKERIWNSEHQHYVVTSRLYSSIMVYESCLTKMTKGTVRELFGNPVKLSEYTWRYYRSGEYPCRRSCEWVEFTFSQDGFVTTFDQAGQSVIKN